MLRLTVEGRLKDVSRRLGSLRDDLKVADEQLMYLADEADDARLRSLVSETPLADRDYQEAEGHAERMRGYRESLVTKIAELELRQDELLDQLNNKRQ